MSDSTNSMSRPNCSARTAYALAAGAAAAAALNASGAIVYSGVQDIAIAQFSSLNLNIDGDASGDLLLKNYVFGGGNYQGATVNFFPGKLIIKRRLTKQDIARMIGASREMVSRVMKDLVEMEHVSFRGTVIVLHENLAESAR